MEKISRDQFLERLEGDWRQYVDRFFRQSPQDQKEFIAKQGYVNLSGLLSHIIAWWQDGVQEVAKMSHDPALPLEEIDVDAFNAQAVQRFSELNEVEIIGRYEAQRQRMADLVRNLPEAVLNFDNVNTRLYYEIIGHWTEHELK
jgi:hypothetical protein